MFTFSSLIIYAYSFTEIMTYIQIVPISFTYIYIYLFICFIAFLEK
jgi:hypothetical protein